MSFMLAIVANELLIVIAVIAFSVLLGASLMYGAVVLMGVILGK